MARKDRACERRHKQYADGKRNENHHGVIAIQELILEPKSRRQRLDVLAQEFLEDKNERVRDYQHERVLNERLEPAPEDPFQGWDDEKRDEERPDQAADGAGDHAEGDDEQE